MNGREELAEVLAIAHFDRQQVGRLDAGRKRDDGQRWQWSDLTDDDQRGYLALATPLADAVLAWLAGRLADEGMREAVERAAHCNAGECGDCAALGYDPDCGADEVDHAIADAALVAVRERLIGDTP